MTFILLAATGFFWFLTIGGIAGGESGGMTCAFLPMALAFTYATIRAITGGAMSAGTSGIYQSRSLPTEFRITKVGSSYVEFQHPEGGSWSYGMTQDLSCVRGVETVEGLGGWRYRMHVTRNPVNAAKVLEAAYIYRNSPKPLTDGAVNLWEIPGYLTLRDEADRDLD